MQTKIIDIYSISMFSNSDCLKKSIILVAMVSLLWVAESRLLHEQQTIEEQNLAYYESLSQQQRDAKVQLVDLKKEIQFLHRTLDQVKDLPSMKTIALQEGLADERDLLYSIQQGIKIPFNLKTADCTDLTEEQQTSITKMVDKIEQQTDGLKVIIDGLTDAEGCSLCDQLKKQYNWDLLYLKDLKESLAPCPQTKPSEEELRKLANLADYTKVSNLNSKQDWVYGDTTQVDFFLKQFNQNGDRNVSKCPEHFPYVLKGSHSCSACPQDRVFDISQEQCVQCPEHTTYQNDTHQCQAAGKENINGTVPISPEKNCGGMTYDQENDICKCPENRPYYTGSKCISCIVPKYFNKQLKRCESCPEGQDYNPVADKCAITNRCESNYIYDQSTQKCVCPKVAPFNSGKKCIACYLPRYWNLDDSVCEYCAEGKYYDIQLVKCMKCPHESPASRRGVCHRCPQNTVYDADNNDCVAAVNGTAPSDCESNYEYDQELKTCVCPEKKPFDAAGECVSCYLPRYWSADEQKCQKCPAGEYYNFRHKDCEYCPLDSPVIIGYECAPCQSGTVFDQALSQCIERTSQEQHCPHTYFYNSKMEGCSCPDSIPFDDGDKCTTCLAPKYWNLDNKQCQDCPHNTHYDASEKNCIACPADTPIFDGEECQTCPDGAIFRKESGICIQKQGFCSSNYVLNEQEVMCECPPAFPFNTGQKCVACYLPKYWDHTDKVCQSCDTNFFYNTASNKCQRCPKQTPVFMAYKCVACPEGSAFSNDVCVEFKFYCSSEAEGNGRNMVYSEEKELCVCPVETPFDDGEGCVSCYLPKYWSHDQKSCLECPKAQYYHTDQLKCIGCPKKTPVLSENGLSCEECPTGTAWHPAQQICIKFQDFCGSNYEYDHKTQQCKCPKKTPFDDGQKCIVCYLPRYWSNDQKQCLNCPTNFFYETSIKKCVRCPQETPILPEGSWKCVACPEGSAFSSENQSCNELCEEQFVYNEDTQECECPKDKPFNDGDSCVSCYLPRYWNHDVKACESCPSHEVYDTSTRKCEECPKDAPLASSQGKCIMCQRDRPFFDGKHCVHCYLPKYWNHDILKCESCPEGEHYDTNKLKCV